MAFAWKIDPKAVRQPQPLSMVLKQWGRCLCCEYLLIAQLSKGHFTFKIFISTIFNKEATGCQLVQVLLTFKVHFFVSFSSPNFALHIDTHNLLFFSRLPSLVEEEYLPPQHIWCLHCPHLPFSSLCTTLVTSVISILCNMPPCAGGERGPAGCEDLQTDAWKVRRLGDDSRRKWGDRSYRSRTMMFGCLYDLLSPSAGLCFSRPVRLDHH